LYFIFRTFSLVIINNILITQELVQRILEESVVRAEVTDSGGKLFQALKRIFS